MSTPVLEKSKPQPPAGGASPSGPGGKPDKPRWSDETYDNSDELPFLRRHRMGIIIGALALGVAVYFKLSPPSPPDNTPVRKAAVPISIQLPPPPLPPPPPPPPPPPKVEQPREEQMEEQTPVADETPPEPEPDNSPPPIGTNIQGSGPADGFGLGKAGGGNGNGGGGGSKWGYYAAQVQNSIGDAIRRNSRTRSATLSLTARIWADDTGRITRATLGGSSGDPALDAALQNEVLTGLQLQSPPPAGMRMPINLRLTARPSR